MVKKKKKCRGDAACVHQTEDKHNLGIAAPLARDAAPAPVCAVVLQHAFGRHQMHKLRTDWGALIIIYSHQAGPGEDLKIKRKRKTNIKDSCVKN